MNGNTGKHKIESLIKFVHLDGVKEFKDTDPSLFSADGISTSTLLVEGDKTVTVTMEDAKHACELFLNKQITLFQLQQWGEWIHMMDFFELDPDGEAPKYDEALINVISDIDMLDINSIYSSEVEVCSILDKINLWLKSHNN